MRRSGAGYTQPRMAVPLVWLGGRKGVGGPMKNLDSVFAAYVIGWAVFFLFYVTIAKRTSDLRQEIERLKNALPGVKRQ